MPLAARVVRVCRGVLLPLAATAWFGVTAAAGLAAAGSGAARPAASPAQTSARPDTPAPAPAQAEYLGSETCLGCHEDANGRLPQTAHGRAAHPASPAAGRSCESCHGPGSRHLEDPSSDDAIRKFARMAPRDISATCRTCHTSGTHVLWEGSTHDARNLSCASCHAVHQPAAPARLLAKATERELCATCHRVQANRTRRVSHMPLVEGRMQCSSCHNVHGATNVRLLRVGNWINESCISCHVEKRGPFLFEHAAGRESCISCHDPHGSSNDRMLVAKAPMLCQRCHIGTRHPSTIYDGLSVQNRSNRIVGRACVNCHQQIHGSNHPSGQSLTR